MSYAHLAPRGRQPRPASDSPTRQRGTDDLLSNLTPRTAVEALRNPAGELKACMDVATPAEQAFAMKAAIASKSIEEWLDELSAWPWPSRGGSAGFEMPDAKRKRLSRSDGTLSSPNLPEESRISSADKLYYGSLLATDVARYERRVDDISKSMEDLDVEEIKSQVLHNHIMPLSRPGSPMMDSGRSVTSSLSAYARMDDMTALITATILQALPNISRLTRLMNAWSLRLLVLRKIPIFLTSLADGEIALQSGWNALDSSSKVTRNGASSDGMTAVGPSTLSRKEFEVMKSILERKVSKAGRDLDAMLDMLEGWEDTLPEHWIDRIDVLERGYGEWTVACERKIREADWARIMRQSMPAPSALIRPKAEKQQEPARHSTLQSSPTISARDNYKPLAPAKITTERDTVSPPADEEHILDAFDGPQADRGQLNVASFAGINGGDDELPSLSESAQNHQGRAGRTNPQPYRPDLDFDFEDMLDVEVPQPELPTLPRPRRDSDVSNPSTVVHGSQSGFMDFSSDQFEHGTPERPRLRDMDMEAIQSDDLSPGNSPQQFRSSTRSLSVSFNDMPTVAEIPDDESSPRTPLKSSRMRDDDLHRDIGSPGKMSIIGTSADDQLQQQISEILESVPAKIRLTSEPSSINLNPPDFTMPTRKTAKHDPNPRSHSSLSTVSNSSRAGTPSFTLAPAFTRNNRTRHQRGNQEIKLYHLSRSNGEAPIKLFIRCVGEHGERVMVRVGGGWADLGEYLKEYASHHGRRSGVEGKVEIKDLPRVVTNRAASTPPTRPASAQDSYSPMTPLNIRKSRKSAGVTGAGAAAATVTSPSKTEELAAPPTLPLSTAGSQPRTPLASTIKPDNTSNSGGSTRSRSSSRLSWTEEDSSLGMAGPRAKQIEMSEESKAWVESVKEKVRIASGERKVSESAAASAAGLMEGKFGEMGKVGATKRLFRRQG
ncbi:hypothetical protein B0H67DRAFT_483843 [Lasiosphaeris hirsuta]|uniref:GAR domain-containing protein n=1 Tax=Lasiosphaeris hirsuta TaxID=260670 RepID=A0AA40APV8_9PEZI|nr:hypothetical protein B0H67DRAFT_483843 [Lasiosphaeris hirsuta]